MLILCSVYTICLIILKPSSLPPAAAYYNWRSRQDRLLVTAETFKSDMATKPVVLPETFNGEKSWDDWIAHFESVADVNEWKEDAAKLKWLQVRLTGRAATAFRRFPEATRKDYKESKKALKKRFEPESKKELYMAEMQNRKKQRSEDWASLGEDLKILAEKAYPDLQAEAQEVLALNHYLTQLENPQIAFGIKQKKPKTVEEAVQFTLEMESYLRPSRVSKVNSVKNDTELIAAASKENDSISGLIERMEKLEAAMKSKNDDPQPQKPKQHRTEDREPRPHKKTTVICRKCGKEGHFARGCAERVFKKQGNGQPSTQ